MKQRGMVIKMNSISRKELTAVLNTAQKNEVSSIAKMVSDKYEISIVRAPQKTLTMVKMREPVGESLFYLGEILCCECMVEIGGIKGFAVCMGDDFEKVKDCAVIDCALNADLAECSEIKAEVIKLAVGQKNSRRAMNGEIMKSRVDFHTMGEM